MSKLTLRCVACAAAIAASLGATAVLAQDAPKKPEYSDKVKALVAPSMRPLRNEETPANEAPNLDRSSEEFNYFRESLGKTELSTKAKKRIAEREARVKYADPMDKPAADGSKFINIYDESEILSDGEPFVDPDDPDVKYEAEENNILSQADETFQILTEILKIGLGVSDSTQTPAYGQASSGYGPPGGSMGPVALIAPPGAEEVGPPGPPTAASTPAKVVAPSKNDDSKMLFPEAVDNPFKAEVAVDETKDFDFFKADREFKPAPPANSSGYGGGPGGMSSYPTGPGPSSSYPAEVGDPGVPVDAGEK